MVGSLSQHIIVLAAAVLLAILSHSTTGSLVPNLDRRATSNGEVKAAAAADASPSSEHVATAEGIGGGAIAGIVCGVVAVVGAVALLLYKRRVEQSRPVHGGRVATVVAMRGAGAMNLQGQMAVLPDDDFHIGTQQGIISYTNSSLEKPARAARPISWYKAREAGVSPLHIQAMTRAGPQMYPIDESDPVQLHSPSTHAVDATGANGALQTPMVGGIALPPPVNSMSEVQIVVESAGSNTPGGRPLPMTPAQQQRNGSPLQRLQHQHHHHQHHQQLETPLEGPSGGLDYHLHAGTATPGHISDVEWDSEEDEPNQLPTVADASAVVVATGAAEPNSPPHPRLFILTPGRDGVEGLHHPENWSRTTFQLHLLCEGASSDFSDAHLTEEHGIAVRDPNAFLRHAARYLTQTAEALIARDDTAFEQAEVFASGSEASEYLELLADVLRAWFSDQLVALEEAAAEGHEVDQELLRDLRAQKNDPAQAAKQELARFLSKHDGNQWNGGLRRVIRGHHGGRWLCASCASRG